MAMMNHQGKTFLFPFFTIQYNNKFVRTNCCQGHMVIIVHCCYCKKKITFNQLYKVHQIHNYQIKFTLIPQF